MAASRLFFWNLPRKPNGPPEASAEASEHQLFGIHFFFAWRGGRRGLFDRGLEKKSSEWGDSNTRPSVPKTDTLPDCATLCFSSWNSWLVFERGRKNKPNHWPRGMPRKLACSVAVAVAVVGVEPTAFGLWFRYSNQLNYTAKPFWSCLSYFPWWWLRPTRETALLGGWAWRSHAGQKVRLPFFPSILDSIHGVRMFHGSSSKRVRVVPFLLFKSAQTGLRTLSRPSNFENHWGRAWVAPAGLGWFKVASLFFGAEASTPALVQPAKPRGQGTGHNPLPASGWVCFFGLGWGNHSEREHGQFLFQAEQDSICCLKEFGGAWRVEGLAWQGFFFESLAKAFYFIFHKERKPAR